MPSISLALVMGLALAWPDLVHRRLHGQAEHHHEHLEHQENPSALGTLGSESHHDAHPHLYVIATPPTKAALHLALVVAEHSTTTNSAKVTVRVSDDTSDSNRPRSPPTGPSSAIRAPPSA